MYIIPCPLLGNLLPYRLQGGKKNLFCLLPISRYKSNYDLPFMTKLSAMIIYIPITPEPIDIWLLSHCFSEIAQTKIA